MEDFTDPTLNEYLRTVEEFANDKTKLSDGDGTVGDYLAWMIAGAFDVDDNFGMGSLVHEYTEADLLKKMDKERIGGLDYYVDNTDDLSDKDKDVIANVLDFANNNYKDTTFIDILYVHFGKKKDVIDRITPFDDYSELFNSVYDQSFGNK